MPRVNLFSLTNAQRAEIKERVGQPGWRRLHPDEAPSFLPDSLRNRSAEIVEVTAQTSTGGAVVMYNAHRIDAPDMSKDHEPFIVTIHESGTSTAGHFVHHGDWEGRTTPINFPSDFSGVVTSSGVAEYYRAQPSSGSSSGPLFELKGGDAAAFRRVTGLLDIKISGEGSRTSTGSS